MSSSIISQELIEQAERENLVPLLGQGISVGLGPGSGLPSARQLAAALAERLDYGEPNLTLARAAQLYEMERGRNELLDFLRQQLLQVVNQPLPVHHLLAKLNWQVAISTCLDDLLEIALRQAQVPFNRIVGDVDVAFEDQSKRLIVQMYGRLDQPESVVVTEMDHLRWQEEAEAVSNLLKGLIASRTLLILGQDLEEDHFSNIYARVVLPFKRNVRRSYACYQGTSPYTIAWLKKLNIQIIPTEPNLLLSQLIERLQARHVPSLAPVPAEVGPPVPIPKQPYRFLNSYEADDRAIFFGREQEKWQVLSKIASFRLVVLYGRSGSGKTSFIQAGLVPELSDRGYHTVYVRVLTSPLDAVRTSINSSLDISLPQKASLHECLTQAIANSEEGLVLFLDQFEGLFAPQISSRMRDEFLKALGQVYMDTTLDLKIVISIRENRLAELSALKPQIPEIFFNDYRLQRLSPEQAREAIIRPVALYQIRYQDGLVERLLEDLGAKRINPPQLQIVCSHLYENLGAADKVITHEQYDALGEARAILAEYVDEVLKQHPEDERAKLQLLLKEFITADEKPSLPTVEDLAQRTALPVDEVQRLLKKLEETRLIRPVEAKVRFELVHEYLILYIASWISEEEQARKRAQATLDQGLRRWQNYQLPLYADELAIINDHRDHLFFSDVARTLMVRSAVWIGYAMDYWLSQATPEQRDQALRAALSDVDLERRRRAASLAGQFACADLIPRLRELVVEDDSLMVRRAAVHSLARLEDAALATWLVTMLDESPAEQRRRILEAIDELQQITDLEVGEPRRFSGFQLRLQILKLRWQRNRRQYGLMTVYAGLGGMIGGIVGGGLGILLENAPSQLGFAPVLLAGGYGFILGGGIGFGFGSIVATEEPRRSILYVVGAALGGAAVGFLLGIAVITPARIVWSVPIGLTSGISSGVMLALLVNLSATLAPRLRLWLRLTLATLLGIFTSGLLFGFGAHVGVVIGEVPAAIIAGTLMITGIVGGLELAERKLMTFQLGGSDH